MWLWAFSIIKSQFSKQVSDILAANILSLRISFSYDVVAVKAIMQ